jgi:hypothetical protein
VEARIVLGLVLAAAVILLLLLVAEVVSLDNPVVCGLIRGELTTTPFGQRCIPTFR